MGRLLRYRCRFRADAGETLIELMVVMAILAAVLTPLTTSMASATRSAIGLARREQDYQNARLALQRMRLDMHCAGGVTSVDENEAGGFTLTLTENHEGQDAWCSGVIPAGSISSGVQWCTVPYSGNTTRFVLYRYLGLDPSACGSGSSSTFQVDYVAQPPAGWPTSTRTTAMPSDWIGNLWPDPTACVTGGLPAVAVDLNVAVDPVAYPNERYELRDQLTLRNANRTC